MDFGDLSVQTNCNVKSQKPYSVAPNTEVLIWGKLPAKCIYGQHGICTNSSYLVKSGLWVAKAVVTVNKTNSVPLKILIPSNNTIFVPRGKVIATFQCFTTYFNLINPRVDTNVFLKMYNYSPSHPNVSLVLTRNLFHILIFRPIYLPMKSRNLCHVWKNTKIYL